MKSYSDIIARKLVSSSHQKIANWNFFLRSNKINQRYSNKINQDFNLLIDFKLLKILYLIRKYFIFKT